jgi:PAS domain S-box-containing protein
MFKIDRLILRPDLSRHEFRRYLVVTLVSLAWVALRWYIWRDHDGGFPFAAMFFPIAFSAYYGGFGPGLASILIVLTLGNLLFVSPAFSLSITQLSTLGGMLAFSCAGLSLCALGEANRRRLVQAGSESDVQKVAQQNLRTNEARLRIAEGLMSAGVWEWDIQSNEVYWSDGYRRLLDYPLEEKPTYEKGIANIHPDDRERSQVWIEGLFRQRLHNWVLEYRILTATGRVRWVTGNGQIFYDEHGKPARMVGINVDITARKAAEQQLRNNEARMRLLLQYARVGGWEWDPTERTSSWSDQMYEVLGLDRSLPSTFEVWLAHIHPEDREYIADLLQRLLQGSEDQFQYEYRFIGSDGVLRYIHDRGMVIRDPDGGSSRLVGVSFDITNRQQQESLATLSS